jgi:hypothetical protein
LTHDKIQNRMGPEKTEKGSVVNESTPVGQDGQSVVVASHTSQQPSPAAASIQAEEKHGRAGRHWWKRLQRISVGQLDPCEFRNFQTAGGQPTRKKRAVPSTEVSPSK